MLLVCKVVCHSKPPFTALLNTTADVRKVISASHLCWSILLHGCTPLLTHARLCSRQMHAFIRGSWQAF